MSTTVSVFAPNHVVITTPKGRYLQSYHSVIIFVPVDDIKPIELGDDWDYSKTTRKYRNSFLSMSKKELESLIKEGKAVERNYNLPIL